MFDTMTFTKAGGAVCGALLVYLLGSWAADTLYHTGGDGHGDHATQAYAIEVEGAEEQEEAEVEDEGPDFASLVAEADLAKGAKVFAKCKACHKLEDGANATGPHLFGIVGREVGSIDGFRYSGKLVEAADVWSPENLNAFLEGPKAFAPGTKMSFKGLSKITDRAALIAYLDSVDD